MGTRHLIAIQLDGELQVAQYGQWDGYPEGQGSSLAKSVVGLKEEGKLDLLKERVRASEMCTDLEHLNDEFAAQIKALDKKVSELPVAERYGDEGRKIQIEAYCAEGSVLHLSRDVGYHILTVLVERPDVVQTVDSTSFAGDGLFCEWAYVVDLDAEAIEVYEGYQPKGSVEDRERFAAYREESGDYDPVKFRAAFTFDQLKDATLADLYREKFPQEEELEDA